MTKGPNWSSPQMFPSRAGYYFNPGIPDRQLWAIGMIVAQWSLTEFLMHTHAQTLTGEKTPLWTDYQGQPSFKHHLKFYKTLVETKLAEPKRAKFLGIIVELQRLKSQRDKIMHGTWAGGMEGDSWSAAGVETSDASLVQGQQLKPVEWKLTFARLKEIAMELSLLNAKYAEATVRLDTTGALLPPHGNVNP